MNPAEIRAAGEPNHGTDGSAGTAVDGTPPDGASVAPPRPWGFWATLGWTLLLGIAASLAQAVVVVVFVVRQHQLGESVQVEDLQADGTILSLATIVGMPVVVAGCWFLAWLCRGFSVRQYLGLVRTAPRTVFRWGLVFLGFLVLSDGITALLGNPIVSDFMVQAYTSAVAPSLIWLGIVVAAPIAEEFLFRGFMFRGLQESRVGVSGAIFLTSACWAVIHLQYDAFQVAVIFFGGLLLGYVRWATGSIYPTIILHAFQNAVATIQVMILVRMLP